MKKNGIRLNNFLSKKKEMKSDDCSETLTKIRLNLDNAFPSRKD